MNQIYLDTNVIISITIDSDQNHTKAFRKKFSDYLFITSNITYLELLSFF